MVFLYPGVASRRPGMPEGPRPEQELARDKELEVLKWLREK